MDMHAATRNLRRIYISLLLEVCPRTYRCAVVDPTLDGRFSLSVCLCLSVCLSLCLSLCFSVSLSLCLSLFLSLSVCLPACLPACLSDCLSLSLCVCLFSVSVSLSVCLSVSVCLSLSVSLSLPTFPPFRPFLSVIYFNYRLCRIWKYSYVVTSTVGTYLNKVKWSECCQNNIFSEWSDRPALLPYTEHR